LLEGYVIVLGKMREVGAVPKPEPLRPGILSMS
jgi:hypothetical protein